MPVFNWLTGHFSDRGKALSLYRRGMARAKKHNHQGAINDYTAAIDMPDIPASMKAMALYNRAVMHVAAGDRSDGMDDLDAVLAMDGAFVNVRSMAKHKLAMMKSRSNNAKQRKH